MKVMANSVTYTVSETVILRRAAALVAALASVGLASGGLSEELVSIADSYGTEKLSDPHPLFKGVGTIQSPQVSQPADPEPPTPTQEEAASLAGF